ncbi:MAG TPA: tRNA uridine-5-carboxymethylaminomethyl(34) synthesis GTPase MnmE [Bacillota bacterium]|nr:tRNA uridine-5-carboxymethylaminomethyl(34) synthesis GTPase MnmE [Bacillota bacterium]
MSKDRETIAAISTPLGEGAIGIVRVSGDRAFAIAKKVFRDSSGLHERELKPWGVRYGSIVDCETGEYIDEALAIAMPAPHSFTREDVVEFSCHGGVAVLTRVLEAVVKCGARLAEPGEFTKRAFLEGRIDLSQAEAVIDVIRAKTDSARRLALANLRGDLSSRVSRIRENVLLLLAHIEASIDFPDDDIGALEIEEMAELAQKSVSELNELVHLGRSSRVYRDGVSVVLAGRPNVGKSSLFNTLVGKKRAIVTDVPGTTRDVIDDWTTIRGMPVRLVDTAGIRRTQDPVERLGVEAANQQAEEADLVVAIIDGSCPICDEDRDMLLQMMDKPGVVAINKSDLKTEVHEDSLIPHAAGKKILRVSAKTGEGICELERTLAELAVAEITGVSENPVMVNLRQIEALEKAKHFMEEATQALGNRVAPDLTAIDIHEALFWLDQITGRSASEDLMEKIFSEFCIGK